MESFCVCFLVLSSLMYYLEIYLEEYKSTVCGPHMHIYHICLLVRDLDYFCFLAITNEEAGNIFTNSSFPMVGSYSHLTTKLFQNDFAVLYIASSRVPVVSHHCQHSERLVNFPIWPF